MTRKISDKPSHTTDAALDRSSLFQWTVLSVLGGALLMYFVDPERGRARRVFARDRLGAVERRAYRQWRRLNRGLLAWFRGRLRKVQHLQPENMMPIDDEMLAQRVESILFRDPRIPKGKITIDAERGVVVLRGAIAGLDDIHWIEQRARRIPGVQAVENLLHPPGTPAPNKRSALAASDH